MSTLEPLLQKRMNPIFVTGIGTGVGKTVASAILVKALDTDYWKPVQCGDLDSSDSQTVRSLVGENYRGTIHREKFALAEPQAPFRAAKVAGITIALSEFTPPATNRLLLIEGAGGLQVPLNSEHTILDLIAHLNATVVLVSRNYLGSINHTLLSVEALEQRRIPIAGILFNGEEDVETEQVILNFTKLPRVGNIPKTEIVTPEFVANNAKLINKRLILSLL